MTVADTGIGLPASVNFDSASSLGMWIVRSVQQKLRGTITVQRTPRTQFALRFPVRPPGDDLSL
jgi:two-component sensor histidine kinase